MASKSNPSLNEEIKDRQCKTITMIQKNSVCVSLWMNHDLNQNQRFSHELNWFVVHSLAIPVEMDYSL